MNIEKQYELRKLSSLGLPLDDLVKYDVLILPENFAGSLASSVDAQDGITLSKLLKQDGINCANSYDLGLEVETIERRSNDLWFGVIYVLNAAIVPAVVSIIANMLTPLIQHRLTKKDTRTPTGNIHTEITIQKEDSFANIKYEGDAETFLRILESLKGTGTNEISEN